MAQSKFIYLDIKGSVLALNSANGSEVWTKKLKGLDFVNVVLDGNNLLAATQGEIFCLDPQTGIIRWNNPLKGRGYGLVSMAVPGLAAGSSAAMAEKRRQEEEQASASAATTSAGHS